MKIISSIPRIWLFIVLTTLVIAFSLAIYGLFYQFIFGYDQARDAWEAYSIWHDKDIKILGPGTDIPGIYHGALWYYFLALPYSVYHHPYSAGVFIFTLTVITIPISGILSYELFKNKYISATTVILYSLSPLFQIFTRWVSNPVISVLITPLLLISILRYLRNGGIKYAVLIGLLLGFLIQSDFAFIIFSLFIPIYFFLYRKRPTIVELIGFMIAFFVSMSTFIIAEIKFNGRTLTTLIDYLFKSNNSGSDKVNILSVISEKFFEFISYGVFPGSSLISLIVVVCLILISKKQRVVIEHKKEIIFLLIWCTNIIIFSIFRTGISNSTFVYAPSFIVVVILFSYLLFHSLKKIKILLFAVIIFAVVNICSSLSYLLASYNPMSAQQKIFIQDSYSVVDETYIKSNGKKFSINTVTNPLYINTTWAYFYEFYGKLKYGYSPSWGGVSQFGLLGNSVLVSDSEDISYLIIEPRVGIPKYHVDQAIISEDKVSTMISEEKIGEYVLQHRRLKK